MISLQYGLVFGIMAAEIVCFVLLILPFPDRWKKAIFRIAGRSKQVKSAVKYVGFLYGFVFILFSDAIVRSIRLQRERKEHQHQDETQSMQKLISMLYAQRNIYLTGFTLLLGLILLMTQKNIEEILETKSLVKKQKAQQNELGGSEEYKKEIKRLNDEKQKLERELDRYADRQGEIDTLVKQGEEIQKATHQLL